jgi:group I intron endonuclease
MDIKDTSGIYAFRNIANGRVYVGQSQKVLTRKKQHERGDTNNSRRFHNAMNKYGAIGFEFTVLEYCERIFLNEREGYWIQKLNALYPNGYNLTSGGGALQRHHEETRKKFSENQKKRIIDGTHIYLSNDFIEKNKQRQIELGKLGKHSSQQIEFKEKRNKTVQQRIDETGSFFKHSAEEIERKRKQQKELYSKGRGKFQDPKLIEHNRQLVKNKLAEGKHHTQREGWSEQAKNAAKQQMKRVFLAIRINNGQTIQHDYQSIHEASRELSARRKSISEMCIPNTKVLTTNCKLGKIIRCSFGSQPNWNLSELMKIPDSAFSRMIAVKFTIKRIDGKIIHKKYDGIREGCRILEADKSAVRWIIKGEKYKSTKCNLGLVIKVEELS